MNLDEHKTVMRRMRLLIAFAAVIVGLYVFRLIFLQLVNGDSFKARATNTTDYHFTVTAARGDIVDSEGKRIAASTTSYNVVLSKLLMGGEDLDAMLQRIVELLQITEEILFDLFLPGHIPVPDQAGDDGIDAEPVRNCLEIGAFCRNYPAFFLHMFSSFLLAGNAGLFRSGVSLFMVFAAFIYFLSYSVLLWTAHICFFQRASSHTTGHL